MPGASQRRIDSHQIDARQRRDLASGRRAGASPSPGLAQAPREGGGPSREPVPRALELATTTDREPGPVRRSARSDELRALSPADYKVVENRLRRMADRQSLQLVKSRRRDRAAPEHGKYMLVDSLSVAVPAGGNWSLDLAEVEQILLSNGPRARRSNARNCPKCAAPTHSLSGLVAGALIDDRECPDCGHSFIAGREGSVAADAGLGHVALAEAEPLDLAGLRLGQRIGEHDRARVLVGRDRGLHVLLQRHDRRL